MQNMPTQQPLRHWNNTVSSRKAETKYIPLLKLTHKLYYLYSDSLNWVFSFFRSLFTSTLLILNEVLKSWSMQTDNTRLPLIFCCFVILPFTFSNIVDSKCHLLSISVLLFYVLENNIPTKQQLSFPITLFSRRHFKSASLLKSEK